MLSSSTRQSAPIRDVSCSPSVTLRPPSRSVRSLVSPPARSKLYPYTVRHRSAGDEVTKIPVAESKVGQRKLRLQSIKQKSLDGRSFSTVGTNSKLFVAGTIKTSKPKAATLSSRPISQASKTSTVLAETSRNVTPSSPLAQKQVSPRQKLGPENWTPITAAKAIINKPPPRLKLRRLKRGSILPKTAISSLFCPVESLADQGYGDIFKDKDNDKPTPLQCVPSEALSSQTRPAKLPVETPSANHTPELRRTRSALSLSNSHSKSGAKTVTWHPSILSAESEVDIKSESSSKGEENEADIRDSPNQPITRDIDIKDCLEIIREWEKTDRSKIDTLLEALRQLDLNSEEKSTVGGFTKPGSEAAEGVVITTVKSLDPRVPEFQSSCVSLLTNFLEKRSVKRLLAATPEPKSMPEPDCNKENIPEIPLQPLPLQPRRSVGNGGGKGRKRPVCILDDYASPGREVNSFDQWYAELQLREFVKRYPLTGTRAPAVRLGGDVETRRVERGSGRAEMVARGSESVGRGGGREGRAGRVNRFTRGKDVRPRRSNRLAMTSPSLSIARDAGIIQERLEVLLLKERERKAGVRDTSVVMDRNWGEGLWTGSANVSGSGIRNFDSRGLDCEASGLVWVPSERLRL